MQDTQVFTYYLRSQEYARESKVVRWWAMSAPYRREMKAYNLLSSMGVECFIPVKCQCVKCRDGSKRKDQLPAIHNMVFVHTSRREIQEIKSQVDYLQYMTRHIDGRNVPIVIADRDMEQFMAVTRTLNDGLMYLTPDEVNLEKGTPVRILGGAFDGVEGVFVKVKGCRNKRVVVMLPGLVGVAMTEISKDLIEVLA